MGFLGSALNPLKKRGGDMGQDYNNPAPPVLQNTPELNQESLPDNLAAAPAMASGGVAPAGQPVVVGDAPKTAYDHAKDDAMHAYSVGKAYLANMAGRAQGVAAPIDNEVESLKQKSANVNAAAATAPPATPVAASVPPTPAVDAVHQAPAKGERRIDTSHMTEPLGAAPVAREEGGPVDEDQPALVGEARPELLIGEDGKKQVVGQAGPEVIKPKEDAVVVPNAATAGPEKGPEMAKLEQPAMPTATAVPTQAPPAAPTHGMASTGMAGTPKTAMAPPSAAPPAPAPAAAAPVDPLAQERALIDKDKTVAMVKGDMTGLGKALIHEKVLHASEANKAVMDAAAGNITTSTGDTVGSAARGVAPGSGANKATMEAAAGGGAESTPTLAPPAAPPTAPPAAPPTAPPATAMGTAPAPKGAFKAREGQYDADIQAARDLGTPEGDVRAAELQKAKAGYEGLHPWGSALNHPGILGKAAHIGAAVGNIAGNIVAPGTMSLIPGTALNKERQLGEEDKAVAAGRQQEVEATKANVDKSGVGKTPQELTYNDLLHGGPGGGPKINPDTGLPWTSQEANVASQGTGKSPEEEYVQSQLKAINPDTGKPFTRPEATADYEKMKTGTKPMHGMEKRVDDYIKARKASGMEDTPAAREAAQTAIQASDTAAKTMAALPANEAAKTFQAGLTEEEQRMNRAGADSLSRGLAADEKQNTEDARHNLVAKQIKSAKDVAESSDTSELAASITPVLATMATTNAEGLKRLNGIELERFAPANGSLYRWAMTHVDKFLAGEIPNDYKKEVINGLDALSKSEDDSHDANTGAINTTIRKGATEPVVNAAGTATATKPSAPATAAPTPTAAPAAAPGAPAAESVANNQKLMQDITMPGGGHPVALKHGPGGAIIVWSGKAGDPWVDTKTYKPVQ